MISKNALSALSATYESPVDKIGLERFDTYAKMLVEWNEKMNLTAITEPWDILSKHFIDSLCMAYYAPISPGTRLVDVGTGAGFPGVPLLIAYPDMELVLIDSLAKRLTFVQAVLDECGLKATLIHGRAEELGHDPGLRETFDIVTARAVAPMNVLAEYCLPFARVGGTFVALKGRIDDVSPAKDAIATLGGELVKQDGYRIPTGEIHSAAVVEKISHTPTQYPRKNKKITDSPL